MIPTTKHTLRFHEDGSFRILMVSDIQDKLEYDPRTFAGLDAIVEAAKPDLVILGGVFKLNNSLIFIITSFYISIPLQ